MDERVTVGFRCHSGWAVAVSVTCSVDAPVVVDRQRIVLLDEGLPRQPYHAVAEAGASRAVIARVEQSARRRASIALASMRIVSVAVVAPPRSIPAEIERVLASHALLHAAEGALYEEAVVDAATDAGLPVHMVDPRTITPGVEIETMGRILGPPWQKDHKLAAAAAFVALGVS